MACIMRGSWSKDQTRMNSSRRHMYSRYTSSTPTSAASERNTAWLMGFLCTLCIQEAAAIAIPYAYGKYSAKNTYDQLIVLGWFIRLEENELHLLPSVGHYDSTKQDSGFEEISAPNSRPQEGSRRIRELSMFCHLYSVHE